MLVPRDFAALAARETGYSVASLAVETYTGGCVAARVFNSQRLLMLKQSVPPRLRYKELLLEGAREHGLCGDYCSWLANLPVAEANSGRLDDAYYDTPSETLARAAAACLAAAGMALAAGLPLGHSP
jgi:hypothetical protein